MRTSTNKHAGNPAQESSANDNDPNYDPINGYPPDYDPINGGPETESEGPHPSHSTKFRHYREAGDILFGKRRRAELWDEAKEMAISIRREHHRPERSKAFSEKAGLYDFVSQFENDGEFREWNRQAKGGLLEYFWEESRKEHERERTGKKDPFAGLADVEDAFRDKYDGRLLFNHGTHQWHVWDDHRWRPDGTRRAFNYAAEECRAEGGSDLSRAKKPCADRRGCREARAV